ncbi:hypothetical protein CD351_08785 [Erythrobacter sp. KY5]|uniref:hypothetical protein n=1 Tax=Erythrobacter sp. KY5 TaxID=2011159 RepID=UPI000DBF1063|nr:hypothetical protein [Erythrobacter sp. KY5]AWW74520.1 hypothetical protein CD351_08785 [Erythrobacter sp. KY5]
MAQKGTGYFDRKGHFFKSAREATESDLAAMLGQIGEGESLAPGIAHTILENRAQIERLFAEHDVMIEGDTAAVVRVAPKVTKLPERTAS